MKPGFVAVVLVFATVATQRVLVQPGVPGWVSAILAPMPWIVGPTLRGHDRRWYLLSFALGLFWDVLFEPVIGPGGISWSCASAVSWGMAALVVNRGVRAWFAFGVISTGAFWASRTASQAILGLYLAPSLSSMAVSSVATGCLCAAVGWLFWFDIPRQWRRYRSKRLR